MSLYLSKIQIENHGSINSLNFQPEFDIDGNPYPIVIVGKNGTGKTLLLSVLVDSLVEIKRQHYTELEEVSNQNYFKIGKKNYIKINENFSYSCIKYSSDKQEIVFTDIVSGINHEKFLELYSDKKFENFDIKDERFVVHGFFKSVNGGGTTVLKSLEENVILFFPSSRYYHPAWLNDPSEIGFKFSSNLVGKDNRNLIKDFVIRDIENWILDLLLDRELYEKIIENIEHEGEAISQFVGYNGKNQNLLLIINQLLTTIYKAKYPEIKSARLGVSKKRHRSISIIITQSDDTEQRISPTFAHLSSGEIMLLSLFSSILKDQDSLFSGDLFDLKDIKGIVIIDEVDLHLHIEFQRTVLPELILMFPKIQFIITTHSPFFLLGMEEKAKDNFTLLNLPDGNPIDLHSFSEIDEAYKLFLDDFEQHKKLTEKLSKQLQDNTKPLIITEGKTDWKHIKKALMHYQNVGEYIDINVNFLEYEDLQMGDGNLKKLCKELKNIPHEKKIICLFDRDSPEIIKEMSGDVEAFKNWGNNVFSFCIQCPENRVGHCHISIEHYYNDYELTTKDEHGRRIFLSSEFSEKSGRHLSEEGITLANASHLKNITNSLSNKVVDSQVFDNEDNNIALSKSDFADNILSGKEGFQNFDLSSFKSIFDVIRSILLV